MKKKIFTLSIVQLVFAILAVALLFLPINTIDKGDTDTFLAYKHVTLELLEETFLGFGWFIYPILVGLCVIVATFRVIKLSKLTKDENAKTPKRLNPAIMVFTFFFGLWSWGVTFATFGDVDNTSTAILLSLVIYVIPSLLMLIVNAIANKTCAKLLPETNDNEPINEEVAVEETSTEE